MSTAVAASAGPAGSKCAHFVCRWSRQGLLRSDQASTRVQTLRELQKAKRALKKAQKQSKAIRRSRYKLKQEEKEAAAAAARECP